MRLGAAVLALALFCVRASGAQDAGGATTAPVKGAPSTAPVQGGQGPPAQQDPAPPIVRTILVEGEQRYSEAQLVSALGQKIGEALDPDAINRGVILLWSSFHVRVDGPYYRELPRTSPTAPAEVELRIIVVEAPADREPRFVGNVSIDTKTLKKWALIEDRVELFEFQASRVRQRLLEGYRREGFYWVEIDIVKRDMSAGALGSIAPMTDLIFNIREGPKVRVKAFEVRGNRSMPARGFWFWKEGLEEFANPQLTAPWFFNWYGSAFVEETLDADVLAMRNIYRERGWLDAVVEREPLRWNEDRSEVKIRIVVDEGKPYVVDELSVEFLEWVKEKDPRSGRENWILAPIVPGPGHPRFSAAELVAKCDLKPGKRYEEVLVNRDRLMLRDLYGEKGHLSHPSLPPDLKWDWPDPGPDLFFNPTTHKLRVTYRIVEGRPLTLREISFAGTQHTLDEVLRREVGVFPGGKADQKEINKGLARIQGTSYFSNQNSPEQHHEPTYRFVEVPGSKELIDLEYQVEEGQVIQFNIAGGVDSVDGLFGQIRLSLHNFDLTDLPSKWNRSISELFRKEAFHGAGQKVDLVLTPGIRVSSARVHFLEPDIFGQYLEPISLDLDLNRQFRIYRTHDEDRFDKSIRFSRRIGFDTSVGIGLVHTDLELFNVQDSGAPAALDRQEALGKSVQAGVSLDFSSRSLDNYIAPHDGWKFGWRNTVYNELLSSDFEYLRSDIQGDAYVSTGAKSDGTIHGFHFELDGGSMPTFGGTTEVPYTERFFHGGSNMRGFAPRGAGNRGEDVLGLPTRFAAGGESYISGSIEWLYPLYSVTQPGTWRQIESLRGALFVDWGVLGDTASELDFEDTRASVGFGIGLAYPIPIQLNFGFPVRRFDGDERQTFSFSIGLSF